MDHLDLWIIMIQVISVSHMVSDKVVVNRSCKNPYSGVFQLKYWRSVILLEVFLWLALLQEAVIFVLLACAGVWLLFNTMVFGVLCSNAFFLLCHLWFWQVLAPKMNHVLVQGSDRQCIGIDTFLFWNHVPKFKKCITCNLIDCGQTVETKGVNKL